MLSAVSYASVYEQTHSRQCCYFMTVNAAFAFVARAYVCHDQSTVYTQLTLRKLPVLRLCAMFERLREFCFVFRFAFRATLLDFTLQIE